MTRRSVLLLSASTPISILALPFQKPEKRVSPHETVSADFNGKTITIVYGRPSLKGREVGKEVAPFGQVWRLGADEATKITVNSAATFANGPELASGSYSLFAIPGPDKWTMIVNKVADQWGAFSYQESQDVKRFDLPVQKLSTPVEEFTISLDKRGHDTAKLTFAWGNEAVSAMLKVS